MKLKFLYHAMFYSQALTKFKCCIYNLVNKRIQRRMLGCERRV